MLQLRAEQGKFTVLKTQEGTELTETFSLYGIYVPLDETGAWTGVAFPGVTYFSGKKIPAYQKFIGRAVKIRYANAQGASIEPPLWAHKCTLKSWGDKNKKGKFFNYTVAYTSEPPVTALMKRTDELYQLAARLYNDIEDGRVAVNRDDMKDAAKPGGADEDIPF